MPPRTVKTTTAHRRDITRRCHPSGKTFYEEAFRTYVFQRITEIAALHEVPDLQWDPGDSDERRREVNASQAERGRRWEHAISDLSRGLNIRYTGVRNDFRHDRETTITPDERQAFEAWEAASRRLEPLRSLVAVVRDLPEPSRESMEAVWERLSEADQASLRGACGDYLMAADLAEEVRRLLSRASASAMEVLVRRHADEPLVAVSHVAEYDRPSAARPLVAGDLVELDPPAIATSEAA